MNIVSPDFRKADEQPETIERKMIRWRAEAIDNKASLWPPNRLRLMLGGQVWVGTQQLVPDKPENPRTAMFIFNCPACGRLGKDYRHGFRDSDSGRYFICNSCDARLDVHELVGSVLHFVGGLAATVRLAWRIKAEQKSALS